MRNNNSISYLLGVDPTEHRTCKECGREFGISKNEKKWFTDRGMALPKRCRDCRDYKRQQTTRKYPRKYPPALPFTLSSVNWKDDGCTKDFVHENAAELHHPEMMSEDRLAIVCTYCKSAENPYAKELIKRAGNFQAYVSTSDEGEKHNILRESARLFGITTI